MEIHAPYYPGTQARYAEFKAAYPNSKAQTPEILKYRNLEFKATYPNSKALNGPAFQLNPNTNPKPDSKANPNSKEIQPTGKTAWTKLGEVAGVAVPCLLMPFSVSLNGDAFESEEDYHTALQTEVLGLPPSLSLSACVGDIEPLRGDLR